MSLPRIRTVRWIPLPNVVGITLPPWGVLIERRHDCDALRAHELVHWRQYLRMRRPRVLRFYVTILLQYLLYGRKYAPMELEAREKSGYPRGG